MGHPYNAGRDDNVGSGFNFDAEPAVAQGGSPVVEFTRFAFDHNGPRGLNEEDYRDAENKP